MSGTCINCGYSPCACNYIAGLGPAGPYSKLAAAAALMMGRPQPHRGPLDTSCPCPECWSLRAATWKA